MYGLSLVFLLVSQSAPARLASISVDGVERTALIYAPKEVQKSPPVVFCFHGHGGNSRQAARSFGMHEAWPEAVVVYPQGLPSKGRTDPEGRRNGWQRAPGDLADRDLKFFDMLLAKVQKDHASSPKRVYAMGHSNGGRFTYVLWAARPGVFAAFGPSGSPATGLLLRLTPKPVFHIAGEKDPLVTFQEQKPTLDGLRRLLGCGDDADAVKSGYLTTEPGSNGTEFAAYVHPGGHEFPRQAVPMMAAFFKRHSKVE